MRRRGGAITPARLGFRVREESAVLSTAEGKWKDELWPVKQRKELRGLRRRPLCRSSLAASLVPDAVSLRSVGRHEKECERKNTLDSEHDALQCAVRRRESDRCRGTAAWLMAATIS